MCGISGIVSKNLSEQNLPLLIQEMNSALRHRGPDSEGYLFANAHQIIAASGKDTDAEISSSNLSFSPEVAIQSLSNDYQLAFAHRRLSIIDLSSSGHQPMSLPDRKLWITYNGEIYNYLELKVELQKIGFQFSTQSDTEVILNAYRAWGKDCVNRFNGMWAFVIYDAAANSLFGSRDRFGVKPLYYIRNRNFFAFASEQKAFLKAGLIKPEMNPSAVFDYFVFSKIEAEPEGMFKGILELMQGQCFNYNLNNHDLTIWNYYHLSTASTHENFNETTNKSFTAETREKITEAIKLRLRSDVPVGSCLSGGMDSSSIVCIMNDLLGDRKEKIKLFTASFEDQKIDEGKWAKMVVAQTNSDWFRTYPNASDLFNDLEHLTYCQDVPIWSTSTYAQYRVMQLAKENGVKVVLDGQGGDELWAGYPHHQAFYLRELLASGKWKEAKQLLNNAGSFPGNLVWFTKQYLKHGGLSALPKAILPSIYKNYFGHLSYLNNDFYEANKNRFELHFENKASGLNEILHKETTSSLLRGYLKCEDRCSMWHSVESRTPFADDVNLIELAFRTPSVYKIHGDWSKFVFRNAMKDIIPEEIRNRRDKMGYSTPNSKWIASIHEKVKVQFSVQCNDILNVDKIQKDYNKLFANSDAEDNGQLFKLISFVNWRKIFQL